MSAPGFVGNLTGRGATFAQENVGDGSDFYNLEWGEVAQANPDPAEAAHIPAGTYVIWDDSSLHYYDRSFDDYKAYMSDPGNHSDPGVQLSWGFPEFGTRPITRLIRESCFGPAPAVGGNPY